jgi:phospholipid/cholesterol/gamma-HCH transport system permease protein
MRGLALDAWQTVREFLRTFGAVQWFFMRLIIYTPAAFLKFGLIVKQVYNAGAMSLVIIMVCGLFVGMVLALQAFDVLQVYGSEESLGSVAALGLFKELGPVVTGLLFAGRAGTALASEIGLMKATDQLSGMEMMAVDPIRGVVVPRFIGGVISMPLLVAIFNGIGIYGAYLVGVILLGVDSGNFWSQMHTSVTVSDVNQGFIKSVVFGVACSLIAVFEGYHAIPTAEGVSRATTRTVVISAISILILDYMITATFIEGA